MAKTLILYLIAIAALGYGTYVIIDWYVNGFGNYKPSDLKIVYAVAGVGVYAVRQALEAYILIAEMVN